MVHINHLAWGLCTQAFGNKQLLVCRIACILCTEGWVLYMVFAWFKGDASHPLTWLPYNFFPLSIHSLHCIHCLLYITSYLLIIIMITKMFIILNYDYWKAGICSLGCNPSPGEPDHIRIELEYPKVEWADVGWIAVVKFPFKI